MPSSESVTVYNRTSKMLHGTWNGRPYDYPPHATTMVPKTVAIASRFQNPVMGRGTPMEDWDSKSEYLLAIIDLGDDATDTEQTLEPQRWDTRLVNGPNTEIVRARGGFDIIKSPQPLGSAFVDPHI